MKIRIIIDPSSSEVLEIKTKSVYLYSHTGFSQIFYQRIITNNTHADPFIMENCSGEIRYND